jgi:hypothetical protein
MSALVLPFPTPCVALEGEEREAALRVAKFQMEALAQVAIGDAFSVAGRIPGIGKLDLDDFVPVFIDAFRRELDKPLGPQEAQH